MLAPFPRKMILGIFEEQLIMILPVIKSASTVLNIFCFRSCLSYCLNFPNMMDYDLKVQDKTNTFFSNLTLIGGFYHSYKRKLEHSFRRQLLFICFFISIFKKLILFLVIISVSHEQSQTCAMFTCVNLLF